jgi:opacity protein-like surface antigen
MRQALLLLLFLTAAPASAEGVFPEKGWSTVGARATWVSPEDSDRSTWGPGIQARYHLSRRFALEGSADYQRHDFIETTAHTAALQASLMAYVSRGRAAAFALGGAGYYATRVNGPSYRRNLGDFGPHAGLGVQFFFNDAWSADLGYRHLWLDEVDSRAPDGITPRRFSRSADQLTVGLNYRLGSRK